jgi:hypothetical protein
MNQIIPPSEDSKNISSISGKSKSHHSRLTKNILKKTNLDPFQRVNPAPQFVESSGNSFESPKMIRNATPIPAYKASSSSFPFFIQEPVKKRVQKNSKRKSQIDDQSSFNLIGKTMANSTKHKKPKVTILNKKIGKKHFDTLTSVNPSFLPKDFRKTRQFFNENKILIAKKVFLPSIHKSSSFQGISNQTSQQNHILKSQIQKKEFKNNDFKFSMTIKGWDWT